MMTPYTLTPSDIAPGEFDVEGGVARLDGSFLLKGVFMAGAAGDLGREGYEAMRSQLRAPQAAARYVPFSDYPTADFTRMAVAAAKRKYPGLGSREAFRRWGRDDILRIGQTTFGRVIMSLVHDPPGALHQFPTVYNRVAKGWGVSITEQDDGILVTFERCPTDPIYQVGQLEGIVMHYGATPTIEVSQESPPKTTFFVRWS